MEQKSRSDLKNKNRTTKNKISRFARYCLIGSCIISIGCSEGSFDRQESLRVRQSYQRYVESGRRDGEALFDAKRGLAKIESKKNMDREEAELASRVYLELGADVLKMISGEYQLKEAANYFDCALMYTDETDTYRARIVDEYRRFQRECYRKGEDSIAKRAQQYIEKYGFE